MHSVNEVDDHAGAVPAAERAFYVQEFAQATIVVSLTSDDLADPACVDALGSVSASLSAAGSRLVLVVGGDPGPGLGLSGVSTALVHPGPTAMDGGGVDQVVGVPDVAWLAELWLAVTDNECVVIATEVEERSVVAARVGAALRALKLVITDEDGGWGRPARSFADVSTHREAYREQLGERQAGGVVEALETALAGGVSSVNLCRAVDLDRELFTFDGTGTLFTSGGYLELARLRVSDLTAVERLVAQGVADGVLRPRSRLEVARLAVVGLGARVVGSGHLAGIVGLETDPYKREAIGEVACLYTVSQFSGSGAGGLLVEGLVEQAAAEGLKAVFAVTVSEAAGQFFLRRGFHEVGRDELPSVKWASYDPVRLELARVFWRDTKGLAEGYLPTGF